MEEKRKQNRYPTKAELQRVVEKEVKKLKDEAVKELKDAISTELKPLRENIEYLMEKDHDEQVISNYLKKHPNKKSPDHLTNQQWLNRELVKIIIYILGILAALIGGPHIWHG